MVQMVPNRAKHHNYVLRKFVVVIEFQYFVVLRVSGVLIIHWTVSSSAAPAPVPKSFFQASSLNWNNKIALWKVRY